MEGFLCDRTLQTVREALLEYERLFGKFPLPEAVWTFATLGVDTSLSHVQSELTDDQKSGFVDRFSAAFPTALKLTCRHAGTLSPATAAWAIRQAVLYAEGKPCLVSAQVPESCDSAKQDGEAPREVQRTLFDLLGEALGE